MLTWAIYRRVRPGWSAAYLLGSVLALGVIAAEPNDPLFIAGLVLLAGCLFVPGPLWLRGSTVVVFAAIGWLVIDPLCVGHWRDGDPFTSENGVLFWPGIVAAALVAIGYAAVVSFTYQRQPRPR